MGNICDCLSNDSDAEGLVPPPTRHSRYDGLRDPIPATLPSEVVTSATATEFSSAPPSRPVAEVHPQTHVAPKKPATTNFPTAATPPAAADIEKVTLPPPPVKSPVKKTSKEGPAAVPRPKAESVVDDPLVDVPRVQIKGSGTFSTEPVYAEIQTNALSVDGAPPVPGRRPGQLPSPKLASPPAGQADDESFAEFVKDRTKSGGSVDTPAVPPTAPKPAATSDDPLPVYAAPITLAPLPATSIDSPLVPVNASTIVPTVVESTPPSSLVDFAPSVATKIAPEEKEDSRDFTEYLDKVVAQTKRTIEETAVTSKHEEDAPSSPQTKPVASIREEEMNNVNLDSTPEKSPSPDDFVAQLAAANANVEKLPVQNSFKQMTEILSIPGSVGKDEKESSPFEIGSSESEFSKPDLSLTGKSLAEELSEFGTSEVDANANELSKSPIIVGAAFPAKTAPESAFEDPFDCIAVDVKEGDGLIPEISSVSLSSIKEPIADIIAIEEEASLAYGTEVESKIPESGLGAEASLPAVDIESLPNSGEVSELPIVGAALTAESAPKNPLDRIAADVGAEDGTVTEASLVFLSTNNEPIADIIAIEEEVSLVRSTEVETTIPRDVLGAEVSLSAVADGSGDDVVSHPADKVELSTSDSFLADNVASLTVGGLAEVQNEADAFIDTGKGSVEQTLEAGSKEVGTPALDAEVNSSFISANSPKGLLVHSTEIESILIEAVPGTEMSLVAADDDVESQYIEAVSVNKISLAESEMETSTSDTLPADDVDSLTKKGPSLVEERNGTEDVVAFVAVSKEAVTPELDAEVNFSVAQDTPEDPPKIESTIVEAASLPAACIASQPIAVVHLDDNAEPSLSDTLELRNEIENAGKVGFIEQTFGALSKVTETPALDGEVDFSVASVDSHSSEIDSTVLEAVVGANLSLMTADVASQLIAGVSLADDTSFAADHVEPLISDTLAANEVASSRDLIGSALEEAQNETEVFVAKDTASIDQILKAPLEEAGTPVLEAEVDSLIKLVDCSKDPSILEAVAGTNVSLLVADVASQPIAGVSLSDDVSFSADHIEPSVSDALLAEEVASLTASNGLDMNEEQNELEAFVVVNAGSIDQTFGAISKEAGTSVLGAECDFSVTSVDSPKDPLAYSTEIESSILQAVGSAELSFLATDVPSKPIAGVLLTDDFNFQENHFAPFNSVKFPADGVALDEGRDKKEAFVFPDAETLEQNYGAVSKVTETLAPDAEVNFPNTPVDSPLAHGAEHDSTILEAVAGAKVSLPADVTSQRITGVFLEDDISYAADHVTSSNSETLPTDVVPSLMNSNGPALDEERNETEAFIAAEAGIVDLTLEAVSKEAGTTALDAEVNFAVKSVDYSKDSVDDLREPFFVGGDTKVLPSPAVLDALDLELTNEDSPRLTVGDSYAGDFNVTEVFSHENVRISHSSPEVVVAETSESQAEEPSLDLRRVVQESTGDVMMEGKGLEKSDDEDDAFPSPTREAGEAVEDIPPIGHDLYALDSTREGQAAFSDESNSSSDHNETASSLELTSSFDASKSGDQLVSDLEEDVLLSSTEKVAASLVAADVEQEAIVTASDTLESSISTVESVVEVSYDTETAFETTSSVTHETPSFEKSVDLAANGLVENILQASTEEVTATAIVADVGISAANEVAAADLAEAVTFTAIEDVAALPDSPAPKSSPPSSEQNSSESKVESSIEILKLTSETPTEEIESANPANSSPSKLFFDEIGSWLNSGGKVVQDAGGGADAATAGESSDEFIVIGKDDGDVHTRAVDDSSIPDLSLGRSDVELVAQEFSPVVQVTGASDDRPMLGTDEEAIVGLSPVASVDSAFEDVGAHEAAVKASPNAEHALLSLDLSGAGVDALDSFDAAVDGLTPTDDASFSALVSDAPALDASPATDSSFLIGETAEKSVSAVSVGATAAESDDEDDFDDDDDDDEFAKIMATARKMDAKAKERGDSDPSAPVGLTFKGPVASGDDDFLARLAKKISRESESETVEPRQSSAHDDTLGSDLSSSVADNTVDTTDTSFYSAKSENTLVEEPSLLDFDEALNKGIGEVLGSLPLASNTTKDDAISDANGHTSLTESAEESTFTLEEKSSVTSRSRDDQEEEEVEGDGNSSEASGRAKKKNSRRKKKKGPTA